MPRIPHNSSANNTDPGAESQEPAESSTSVRRSRRLQRLDVEFGELQPASGRQRRPPNPWPRADTAITRGYRQAPMPTDVQVLRAIHVNAKLADYVYTRDASSLPGGWAPSPELAHHVRAALNLAAQPQTGSSHGTLVDEGSGLVATVLVSRETREVVLAFGGTTAGPVTGSGVKRVIGNLAMIANQWKANVEAGLGGLPASYAQATASLRTLGSVVGQGAWAGYKLRTVGHSKGAGEAAFAALSQTEPLEADVFSPAHLSHGLIERLPFNNVIRAVQLVRAYSVETDIVPSLRNLPLSTIDGVGTEHKFPVDLTTGTSLINVHERFVQHLETYMRRCAENGAPALPARS